jgi:DNA primase
MGKTYIDTVKYVIYAHCEIEGVVEKPDVVGALFGQTEGLLGDELDLRELQKSGRIGRIEVDLKTQGTKSTGKITLPSSLDRIETAILGAALETVDRVGPCEAKIIVEKIEDTRTQKREQVVNRAKTILTSMITDIVPESKEISGQVRDEVKVAEVRYYGSEKLPCGPNIDTAEHIIIVEGRADVLTLLKCDIENVIALQGKNIPQAVIDLTREKTVTVFVDGDRGGDLIIKQMSDIAEVDFVAKAPDGKEVEELTKKEVIKALRRKLPLDQFMMRTFRDYDAHRKPYPKQMRAPVEQPRMPRPVMPVEKAAPLVPVEKAAPVQKEVPAKALPFGNILKELAGSLKGALLNSDNEVIIETDVRNLAKEIEINKNINAIVFDGIVTQRLVDLANDKGIKYIAGIKSTRIENTGNVEIITAE